MEKPLPLGFTGLALESGPNIVVQARRWHGLQEIPGPGNSPAIMSWAAFVGASSYYKADATPWCALFLAYCVKMAGFALPHDPLHALAWADWGTAIPRQQAALGDVLVMGRAGGGGHVTIYVAEDNENFYGLGGNQGDAVCIAKFSKIRIEHVRRCPWKVKQPDNVRRIVLGKDGNPALSTKES